MPFERLWRGNALFEERVGKPEIHSNKVSNVGLQAPHSEPFLFPPPTFTIKLSCTTSGGQVLIRPWVFTTSSPRARWPRGGLGARGAPSRTGSWPSSDWRGSAPSPRRTPSSRASPRGITLASGGPRRTVCPPGGRSPGGLDLDRLCSLYTAATVLNDNTVRTQGTVLQIPPGPGGRGYAKARVEVRQLPDGSWRIYHQERLLATLPASAGPPPRSLRRKHYNGPSRRRGDIFTEQLG